MPGMGETPWWYPGEDDADWDEPLPEVIELSPDYMADLPLWGECGAIAWQRTKFSPELLDRLAALAGGLRCQLLPRHGLAVCQDARPVGPPGSGTGRRRARRASDL